MARKINSYQWTAEVSHPVGRFTAGKFLTKRAALKHEQAVMAALDKITGLTLGNIKLNFEHTGGRRQSPVAIPRIPRALKM